VTALDTVVECRSQLKIRTMTSKTSTVQWNIKGRGGTDRVIMQIWMDYILTDHTPRMLMV